MRGAWRAVYRVAAIVGCAGMAGCGGTGLAGLSQTGTDSTGAPSKAVAQLAGKYSVNMVASPAGAVTYPVVISGISNTLSGSGTSSAGGAFSYTGSLDNSGNVSMQVADQLSGTNYSVSGTMAVSATGDVIAQTSWSTPDGNSGGAAFARIQALPVAGGPAGTLVATLMPVIGGATPTGGVASYDSQLTVYTTVGSQLYGLNTSSGLATRPISLSSSPTVLALSADGSALYAGGSSLDVLTTKSGTVRTVAATNGVTWLSAPLAPSAASRAYYGTGDGAGHTVVAGTPPTAATLPAPATGLAYSAAAVTGDGARLLASTTGGLFAMTLPAGTLAAGPYRISPVLANFLAPIAASPAGHVVYAIDNGSKVSVARIYSVDMDAQALLSSGNIGASTTRFADMAVSPDGSTLVVTTTDKPRAYVVNSSTLATLEAIDVNVAPTTGSVSATVTPRVAISRDSTRAYISGQSSIAVIRLK